MRYAEQVEQAMKVETATRFLTALVDDEECAYSTQKQALNALAFFFKQVCRVEDPRFDVKLKKTEQRVPVVLSTEETSKLFDHMGPRYELAARLQYGAGLRLSELIRLRIKDVDLGRGTVTVRCGRVKGYASRDHFGDGGRSEVGCFLKSGGRRHFQDKHQEAA